LKSVPKIVIPEQVIIKSTIKVSPHENSILPIHVMRFVLMNIAILNHLRLLRCECEENHIESVT
jgi:hypothetical protein